MDCGLLSMIQKISLISNIKKYEISGSERDSESLRNKPKFYRVRIPIQETWLKNASDDDEMITNWLGIIWFTFSQFLDNENLETF